jgi:hypothetical protein
VQAIAFVHPLQVVYKTIYLLLAELPAWREGRKPEGPAPMVAGFIGILLLWPVAIATALRWS